MDSSSRESICPECGRAQPGKRNFCPYCGYSFREEQTPEPGAPLPRHGGQAPEGTAPPSPPVERREFASADGVPLDHRAKQPPSSRKQRTDIPQAGAPSSAPRAAAHPRRRFRLVDRRVLFGLLGMVDLPLVLVLVALLILPRVPRSQPSLCEQLDPDDFAPTRYERGLGGELADDTLLSADTEYLIQETLVVPKNRRLFIQPGARLVFDEGAALEVHGNLYACGSERKPLTFTSDEGEAGSWTGIRLYGAGEESVISHALVQFAGDRALHLDRSAPTLVDVKIANSSGFPISISGNEVPTFSGGVELDDNPFNAIEIRSGKLEEASVTWPNSGFVYVVSGPLEVGANTTLTIEPDVTVKFWRAPNGRSPGIGVRGLLKAEGVQFTSVYDSRDTVGGVTYREAEDPQPGDWAGIGFYESSNKSYLRRCLVRFAGEGKHGAISMQGCSPELTDVTVADTAWYPLSVDADSFPSLNNLTLEENNPGDALEVRGGSAVTGRNERTWEPLPGEPQIVRVIRGDVTVEPEAVLTIEPGTVVKFEEDGRLIIKGTLRAVGEESDQRRIVFTSLRDGDHGGDTDKTTGPQDPRNWRGIVFDGADGNSILQHAIVRYGPVVLNNASPRLVSSLIKECETAAMQASPGSSPVLQAIRLEHNAMNGIAIQQGGIQADQTWSPLGTGDQQIARVLVGEVTIEKDATLSIEPGTIIKASSGGRLRLQGGLRVLGNANDPVVFTSINDDSAAGNTNQRLEEPRAGDWPGIEIGPDAWATFSRTVIRYAERGLSLHGEGVPVIEGWLRIVNGEQPIWCDAEIRLPDSIQYEGNMIDVEECPSQ